MNWDTDETINWFLNDEYLYQHRKGSARSLKFIWKEVAPTKEVKISQVDWDQVANFFEGE